MEDNAMSGLQNIGKLNTAEVITVNTAITIKVIEIQDLSLLSLGIGAFLTQSINTIPKIKFTTSNHILNFC